MEESIPAQYLPQLTQEARTGHDPKDTYCGEVDKSAGDPIRDRSRNQDVGIDDQPHGLLIHRAIHL